MTGDTSTDGGPPPAGAGTATLPGGPAAGHLAPAAEPEVVLADGTCIPVLSQVIADAMHDLRPCRWLVPGPAGRRQILPGCFRLLLEHALADGLVHTTASQDAAAVWLPAGERPGQLPGGYDEQLAAVTGPWADRFRAFGQALGRRPAGVTGQYLAILAVRPDRQGQGLGSALLRARHAGLDRDGIPACLHAASLRTRRLFHAHGYQARGLAFVPGAVMYPMTRWPAPATWPPAPEPAQDSGAGTPRETREHDD